MKLNCSGWSRIDEIYSRVLYIRENLCDDDDDDDDDGDGDVASPSDP